MDDRPYYYRVRGRTLGPVGLRQIRQLAQRAQIGRTTDVSRDGMQWGKAADWAEIFETGGGFEPQPEIAPVATAGGFAGPAIGFPNAPAAAASRWYYSINGASQGPVDIGVLQQMVAQGQISANDYVCPEGASDWMTVGSVPQLQGGRGPAGPGPAAFAFDVTNPGGRSGVMPRTQGSRVNGLAIAGFVVSLVALLTVAPGCLCIPINPFTAGQLIGISLFVAPPVGICGTVLSGVAMAGKNRAQMPFAISGLILGIVTLVGHLGFWILVFVGALSTYSRYGW